MQFLPTTNSDTSANIISTLQKTANTVAQYADEIQGQSFGDLFDNLMEYSETTAGIPAGFRSVKDDTANCTSADLDYLSQELARRGVNKEALACLEQFKGAEKFPTVGELFNAMRGTKRKGKDLSEQEELDFVSVLKKMGFTQEESDELLEFAKSGKGVQLFQALQNKFAQLDGNFDLHANECAAMLQALDLSPGVRADIMQMFNGQQTLSVNKDSLDVLLGKAGQELAALQSASAKLAVESDSAVKAMLENAKQREKSGAIADKRGSKNSEQSEKLMRDSATSTGEGNAAHRQSGAASLQSEFKEDKNGMQNLLKDANYADEKWEEQRQSAKQSGKKNHFLETTDSVTPGKKNVVSADVESAKLLSSPSIPSGVVLSTGNTTLAANSAGGSTLNTNSSGQPVYYDKLFSQVERGILQQAIDGSRQITMRLDPPDLGQITITLKVQHGDLKAIIRADQPEAAQALSEQLAALKTSLEEQGFKVSSLEVETRLQENPGQNMSSSAEQQAKEEQARENARFLGFSRSRSSSEEILARNVQNSMQMETISHSGLHIVA